MCLEKLLKLSKQSDFLKGFLLCHLRITMRLMKRDLASGKDWMLTCIMRQQAAVASLSVAGGIILSLESAALNISKICKCLASIHGKTSIINLEHAFNDTFGTRISTSKLAEKLKSSGSWEKIVTDSMDEYIDSLVDDGLSDMNADDLLREEFF